jgi:hypothetical protein
MKKALMMTIPMAMAMGIATQPANAYFKVGNDVYLLCQSNDPEAKTVGLAYTWGVFDADETLHKLNWTKENHPRICLSEGVTGGQMFDVVCKWLSENPKLRNKPAGLLVRGALADAWPCKR